MNPSDIYEKEESKYMIMMIAATLLQPFVGHPSVEANTEAFMAAIVKAEKLFDMVTRRALSLRVKPIKPDDEIVYIPDPLNPQDNSYPEALKNKEKEQSASGG